MPSLLFCILLSVTCSAETQSCYNEARSATDRLRKSSPPAGSIEESGNILATFDEADILSLQNRTEEAEKLYLLSLLKCYILNKKIHYLDTSSRGIKPPASLPEKPGDANRKKYSRDIHTADSGPRKETALLEGVSSSVGVQAESNVPSPRPTYPVLNDGSSEKIVIGKKGLMGDVEEEDSQISSPLIIGKEFVYTVKKRESLRMVGAKLGVGWRTIARENDLDTKKPLSPGQELVINTRRIIPKTLNNGILINIPDRTMYLFRNKKLEKTVPVALGKPTSQNYGDWRTPTGHFRILAKMKNPTWHVPPSIQNEMKLNKSKVVTEVPPGNDNPLGKYALMTSLSGIMIHGTTRPASIYNFASHGCIRVDPKNMEEIFPEIPVQTKGEIVYQPVKIALSDDGRVFIEVHGDIYKRFKKLEEVANRLIFMNKAEEKVDWNKVRTLLRKKSGVPEDVTLEVPETDK